MCSECQLNLVPLEADDFAELCEECSSPKYQCTTPGCLLTFKEQWKSLCDNCYNKPLTIESSTVECLTPDCHTPIPKSYRKYCDSCFSKANPRTPMKAKVSLTSGAYQCVTPGCDNTFPEKWKKTCITCWKLTAPPRTR